MPFFLWWRAGELILLVPHNSVTYHIHFTASITGHKLYTNIFDTQQDSCLEDSWFTGNIRLLSFFFFSLTKSLFGCSYVFSSQVKRWMIKHCYVTLTSKVNNLKFPWSLSQVRSNQSNPKWPLNVLKHTTLTKQGPCIMQHSQI